MSRGRRARSRFFGNGRGRIGRETENSDHDEKTGAETQGGHRRYIVPLEFPETSAIAPSVLFVSEYAATLELTSWREQFCRQVMSLIFFWMYQLNFRPSGERNPWT